MLNGKTALITGGAQGLGKAFAERFALEGANLVIVDRKMDRAEETAHAVETLGASAIAVRADVAVVGDLEAMARTAESRFGIVDILVNSAGVFDTVSIDEMSEEIWDRAMAINVKGGFFAVKTLAPGMRRKGYGKVINLSSIAGLGGFLNCPAYCASKGAVVNLTKALACELGRDGIRVNAIAPGPVETPMNARFDYDSTKGEAHRRYLRERTPSGADFFKVEDVTGTALYLASPASDAVTGLTLPVDGGWTAW